MQPYFFPYLGYFRLLNSVDRWIAFDEVQFIDKGWINRNRILHTNKSKEWQYITLPLYNKSRFDKISEISIDMQQNWRANILGKLTLYQKIAPFYSDVIELVEYCFSTHELNLAKFVTRSMSITAEFLGINTRIDLQSDLNLLLPSISHPGEWALRISEHFNATEYINPASGRLLFNQDQFDKAGIKLTFMDSIPFEYSQRRPEFTPNLSIIDVMMFNSRDTILKAIE